MKNITKRISRKNLNLDSTLPLTISAQYGLVDQRKFFDKQIASKKLENYLLLKNGEFAYNKSYSKDYPFGAIKRLNNYKLGVLSTLYIAFKPVSINTDYLEEYFDSTKWYKEIYKRATEGARNHGLLNISPQDFFELNLSIPNNRIEQERISKILKLLSLLITLQQRKEKQIKLLKKAMLQTLFTTKTVPQLRFKGFTDNWEQRKLGEICKVTKLAGFEFTKYVNYSNTGSILAIRGINVKKGKFNLQDVKYIDNSNFSRLSRSKLQEGDILFTYVGTIGNSAIVPKNVNWYLAPNVCLIRPQDKNSSFISYLIQSDRFQHEEIPKWITTSSQPALSMENIRKFKIILPLNSEQQKISSLVSKIDKLITLQQNKTKKLENLKQFLLQNMFI